MRVAWSAVCDRYEDAIVEAIQEAVTKVLVGANASRTFYTQGVLPSSSTASGETLAP